MKGLILILIVLKTAFVFGQVAVFSAKYKTIKFPKTPEGEQLNFSYEIKNKGKAPLELYSWEAECTCTDVILPSDPILPGEFATIDVVFDTNGKYFFQNRIIYIKSNSRKKRELLRFKVFVEPKPLEEKPTP
ncbi:DUF1573 domain-containing protein [Crocinitomicaceae bacterium]|nr:DUF1573 domain-containing protein [Crocinitomicaceae bacterium]